MAEWSDWEKIKMKTVAVLMSTYNAETYLRQQINSILNQTTECSLQLIIRDDGSTDETENILKEYAEKNDLIYTVGNNIGPAVSFLTLLHDNVGYDYYAFADQDDVWNSDKIQRGIEKIKHSEIPTLYYSNAELVDERLNSLQRCVHRHNPTCSVESALCLTCSAQGCTSLFNKELAKMVQNTEVPNAVVMHDSLMTCLCFLVGGRVIFDSTPTMKYRIHTNNVVGLLTARRDLIGVLRERFEEVFRKREPSMYLQAKTLLDIYGEQIEPQYYDLCKMIIRSEYNFLDRIKLMMNHNIRHDTFNMTVTRKISILLGNG